MPVKYGLTHLSGLSVGIDPARADLAPRERSDGAYFSVGSQAEFLVSKNAISIGTAGTAIVNITSSVVSVDPASMAAGSASTLTVAVPGALADSCIIAHPISSLWSAEYARLNYHAYGLSAGVVEIAFSNTTGATINADDLNWRVTVIDF